MSDGWFDIMSDNRFSHLAFHRHSLATEEVVEEIALPGAKWLIKVLKGLKANDLLNWCRSTIAVSISHQEMTCVSPPASDWPASQLGPSRRSGFMWFDFIWSLCISYDTCDMIWFDMIIITIHVCRVYYDHHHNPCDMIWSNSSSSSPPPPSSRCKKASPPDPQAEIDSHHSMIPAA